MVDVNGYNISIGAGEYLSKIRTVTLSIRLRGTSTNRPSTGKVRKSMSILRTRYRVR